MVVKDFLNGYFGIQRKHVGSAGVAVVGFTVLFAFIFAFFNQSVQLPEKMRSPRQKRREAK